MSPRLADFVNRLEAALDRGAREGGKEIAMSVYVQSHAGGEMDQWENQLVEDVQQHVLREMIGILRTNET